MYNRRVRWSQLVLASAVGGSLCALLACSLIYSVNGFGGASDAGAESGGAVGVPCGPEGGVCEGLVCCISGGFDLRNHGRCTLVQDCAGDYAACARSGDCTQTAAPGSICCLVSYTTNQGSFHQSKCLEPSACDSGILVCDPQSSPPCPGAGACVMNPYIGGLSSCPPP
jgi:hypothetical protein